MKRFYIVLLSTLLLFALTSCKEENEPQDQVPSEVETFLQENYPSLNFENVEFIINVGGFDIYETDNSAEACDTPVSFEREGFTFSTDSGCEESFISLGYIALKENQAYSVETLLSIGRISTEFMYDFVYNKEPLVKYTFENQVNLETFSTAYSQSENLYGVYIYYENSVSNSYLSKDIKDLISENPFKVFTIKLDGFQYENYTSTLAVFKDGKNIGNYRGIERISNFVSDIKSNGYSSSMEDSNIELIRDEYIESYESFPTFLAEINGYKIYNNITLTTSCIEGASLSIDGYQYGNPKACDDTFDGIGYIAIKDNSFYSLDSLMNNNEITYNQLNNSLDGLYTGIDYNDIRLLSVDKINEILTQEEDDYYVYVYSLTCQYCQVLKPNILDFIANDTTLPIYVASIQTIGTNGIQDFLDGVPALLHIVNGVHTETYAGIDEIQDFIDAN